MPKKTSTPFPDPIPEDLRTRVSEYLRRARLPVDRTDALIEAGREWALAGDKRYAAWHLVFSRAIREGWSWASCVLPVGGSPSYAERSTEETKSAARAVGAGAEGDPEQLLRIAALTQMFLGYGQPVTDERIEFYLSVTQYIPAGVFREAVLGACAAHKSGFAPGPGAIIDAAVPLAPAPENPGYERGKPRWWKLATRRIKAKESPREIGARTGSPERITRGILGND